MVAVGAAGLRTILSIHRIVPAGGRAAYAVPAEGYLIDARIYAWAFKVMKDDESNLMSELITLELSEEIIERARFAADRRGQALQDVLKDWLEHASDEWQQGSGSEDDAHTIYTPVGSDATAEALEAIYREHVQTQKRTDQIES